MRLLPVLVTAAAVVLSGCMGGDDPTAADDSRLSPAELGWLRAYSAWTIAIHDEELGPPGGPRLVEVCREQLEEVGDPPTDRLKPAIELAADACPLLARRGMFRRALDVIEDSDELLLAFLRELQPIPLETGVTEETRADVDFSRFATDEVGEPVEVRCWDEQDWKRVVEEDNAWNADYSDPDDLFGWAEDASGRVHMRLDHCNAISQLRDGDGRAWSKARQLEAAEALGTLVHEVNHLSWPDYDEAEIECEVLDRFEYSAVRLGASESRSGALARLYRTEIYPEQPEEYVTDDCDE